MKKLSILIVFCLLTGCVCGPKYPKGFVSEVQLNAARMESYLKQKTTADQDRLMLEANLQAWLKLREVVK